MNTKKTKLPARNQSAPAQRHVLMMANQRKFLDHVAKYAAEHNWRLTILSDGLSPKTWEGDGALMSFSRSAEQMAFVKKFSRGAKPCVGMSYTLPRLRMPRVLADFAEMARLAVKCLTENGYTNFAFYTSERLKSGSIAYRAFVKELKSSGYRNDVPWFVRDEIVGSESTFDPRADARVFTQYFSGLPRPLGVWCMSDTFGL